MTQFYVADMDIHEINRFMESVKIADRNFWHSIKYVLDDKKCHYGIVVGDVPGWLSDSKKIKIIYPVLLQSISYHMLAARKNDPLGIKLKNISDALRDCDRDQCFIFKRKSKK